MIKIVPVPSCAACPYRQYHYGNHECAKMEFKLLPKQDSQNGKNVPFPNWCPLPDHPTAND